MKRCLLVVDVQADFCTGGALPVPEGEHVVSKILPIIDKFDLAIASMDWHPEDHCLFDVNGGPWPVHCVKDSYGSLLHPGLRVVASRFKYRIFKGQNPDHDSYSAFADDGGSETLLKSVLGTEEIDQLYVCGLATEYCVKATVLDAIKREFETYVIHDACRGMDANAGDVGDAFKEMQDAGAVLVEAMEV